MFQKIPDIYTSGIYLLCNVMWVFTVLESLSIQKGYMWGQMLSVDMHFIVGTVESARILACVARQRVFHH